MEGGEGVDYDYFQGKLIQDWLDSSHPSSSLERLDTAGTQPKHPGPSSEIGNGALHTIL